MGRSGQSVGGVERRPTFETRKGGRGAARELSAEPHWDFDGTEERAAELDGPEMRAAKRKTLERRAEPGLSQTNRGLRMILVATVLTVAISWGATVSNQFIEYLKIQELTEGDPNALRVMCALHPPKDVSLIHLCETVATAPLEAGAVKAEPAAAAAAQ